MACEICKNSFTPFLVEKDGYSFSKCSECGHVFLNPMPLQEDLNKIYSIHEKTESLTGKNFFPKSNSRRRRAFTTSFKFMKYVWGGKKVLDIGCGGGFMAESLRKMGGVVTGIDIDDQALTYANANFPKCNFVNLSFEKITTIYQNEFDFIYSSEVMEHINKLNDYMIVLQNICRVGGYVYITTPDEGHRNRPNNILDWDVFTPPVHVRFFNRNNIEIIFRNNGFELIKFYNDSKCGLKALFRKIPA